MVKGQFKIRKASNQGTSNPIIARLHVGAFEIINWAHNIDKDQQEQLRKIFWDIGLTLLKAESIGKKIQRNIELVIRLIKEEGIKTQSNERCIELPYTEDLDEIRDFLKCCKKILQKMIGVFNIFLGTKYTNPKYHLICKDLESRYGNEDEMTRVVTEDHNLWIKKIIDLRNEDEHPSNSSALYNDFDIYWDKKYKKYVIIPPVFFSGDHINEFIESSLYNLLTFSEETLVNFIKKSLPNMVGVYEIPEQERNQSSPIRFRMGIKTEFIKK